jgi:hypothetical protein
MMLLYLFVPALSRLAGAHEVASYAPLPPPRNNFEQYVMGGKRLTGFLVIADNLPLPHSVPALHASQFSYLLSIAPGESDLGPLLPRALERVPFAFVAGGRLDWEVQSNMYVAPPIVLTRPDVNVWKFLLRPPVAGQSWNDVFDVEKMR